MAFKKIRSLVVSFLFSVKFSLSNLFLNVYMDFKGNVILTLFFLLFNKHNKKVTNDLNYVLMKFVWIISLIIVPPDICNLSIVKTMMWKLKIRYTKESQLQSAAVYSKNVCFLLCCLRQLRSDDGHRLIVFQGWEACTVHIPVLELIFASLHPQNLFVLNIVFSL